MCRTIGCIMSMTGHGKQIHSMSELMALLGQMGDSTKPKAQTQEEFILESIKDAELNIRMSETVIDILRKDPPQLGASLVSLEGYKPIDPETHGFATVVTYALASGAYLVVGTDHLSQRTVQHDTPNIQGLEGLQEAIKHELTAQMVDETVTSQAPETEQTQEAETTTQAETTQA